MSERSGGRNVEQGPGLREYFCVHPDSRLWSFLDFVAVFTVFVGINYMGLPYTVAKAGVIPTTVILLAITATTFHGCYLLLVCKEKVEYQRLDDSSQHLVHMPGLGYATLAREAFGVVGELLATTIVFTIHFCFCVGYIIFLGQSLESLAEDFHPSICQEQIQASRRADDGITEIKTVSGGESGLINLTNSFQFYSYGNLTHDVDLPCQFSSKQAPDFTLLVWMVSPLFVLMCLSTARLLEDSLNVLSFLTVTLSYIALVAYLLTATFEDSYTPSYKLFAVEGMLFTFGQASSTLEGMGMVTELNDDRGMGYQKLRLLIGVTFFLAVPSFLGFGILGYTVFGDTVQQVITHSLPPNYWLSLLINALIILMILSNFPNVAEPATKILDTWVYTLLRNDCLSGGTPPPPPPLASDDEGQTLTNEGKPSGGGGQIQLMRLSKVVSRVGFVCGTVAVSTLMRHSFIYITAFTGAMDNSLLSLIFPGAIHLKLLHPELSFHQRAKDVLLIVLGLVLCCVSIAILFIGRSDAFHEMY